MKRVFCVGLIVLDIPLRPLSREVFDHDGWHIEKPVWAAGGDAANVAITLRKLGLETSLCAMVGQDVYGDFLLERLETLGVNTRPVIRHPELDTGVSYLLIEPEGERHFLGYSNINDMLSWEHIDEQFIAESDLVFVGSSMCMRGLDEGASAKLFKKAHELGKITATDFSAGDRHTSDEWLKLLEPMLAECDILMPSYLEAKKLSGKEELPEIRERFSGFGAKILIVKLGSKGCYLTDFKNEWNIASFNEFKPVDTTGAGDSFVGGFLRAYLEGWKPQDACIFGNIVASYNVTKVGATGGVPDFETAYGYACAFCGGETRFPLSGG
ncbi:MAG: carbohydrate kinase family protein [Treponema sp.]|jgi:sugar/nucleoside kinase (ribokinase family)|nr:carbohydrate kinase family protein [Treponema sp.]